MKESLGVAPYGGDLNKIPARIVDAFIIIQNEHARVESLSMQHSNKPQQQPQPQQRKRR